MFALTHTRWQAHNTRSIAQCVAELCWLRACAQLCVGYKHVHSTADGSTQLQKQMSVTKGSLRLPPAALCTTVRPTTAAGTRRQSQLSIRPAAQADAPQLCTHAHSAGALCAVASRLWHRGQQQSNVHVNKQLAVKHSVSTVNKQVNRVVKAPAAFSAEAPRDPPRKRPCTAAPQCPPHPHSHST